MDTATLIFETSSSLEAPCTNSFLLKLEMVTHSLVPLASHLQAEKECPTIAVLAATGEDEHSHILTHMYTP